MIIRLFSIFFKHPLQVRVRIIPHELLFQLFLLPDIFEISNENSEWFPNLTTDAYFKPPTHKLLRRLPKTIAEIEWAQARCKPFEKLAKDFELTNSQGEMNFITKLTSELVSLYN